MCIKKCNKKAGKKKFIKRRIFIFILEILIKEVNCKDKDGEVTNKAIAHQKRELHEPGEICVSVSRQFKGAQKYQGDLLRGIGNSLGGALTSFGVNRSSLSKLFLLQNFMNID